MGEYGHEVRYLLPFIGTLLFFCVTIFFNAVSSNDLGKQLGLYVSSTGDVSDRYDTTITPSGWTFSIWGVIYLWQSIWILYALTLTCRKGIHGYLYYSPPIMPWHLHLVYMVNLVLNIAWLLLWDREEMLAALCVAVGMSLTAYVCLFLSYRAVSREGAGLIHNGFKYEPGMVIAFVHNGLAVYSTWLSIATLLNLSIVMSFVGTVDVELTATVALTLLLVELLVWFLVENLALDRHTRWTITPYFVVVFALFGIIDNNYVEGERNSIYMAVLEGVAILCLVMKLVIASVRECRRPLWFGRDGSNAGLKA